MIKMCHMCMKLLRKHKTIFKIFSLNCWMIRSALPGLESYRSVRVSGRSRHITSSLGRRDVL